MVNLGKKRMCLSKNTSSFIFLYVPFLKPVKKRNTICRRNARMR